MSAITKGNQLKEPGALAQSVGVVIVKDKEDGSITLTSENGLQVKLNPEKGVLSYKETLVTGGRFIGLSNAQLGALLNMALDTVKTHVKNILQKLHANNANSAAAMAVADGVIEVSKVDPKPFFKSSPITSLLMVGVLYLGGVIPPWGVEEGYNSNSDSYVAYEEFTRRSGSRRNNKTRSYKTRIREIIGGDYVVG